MFIIVYFLTLWTADSFIGTAEVFGMVFSAIVCKIEVKVSSSSFIPTTVSGVNCDSHVLQQVHSCAAAARSCAADLSFWATVPCSSIEGVGQGAAGGQHIRR